MKIFRKLQVAMLTIAVVGTAVVEGNARDRAIDGLIVGAGSGALVGQAIGRDAEATLIGTAVGGMLGYMAGNEMARDSYGRGYAPVQAGLYLPPPPIPQVVFSFNRGDYYSRGDYHRDGYRPHHRSAPVCWEKVVKVERRHGRYREVVKTVCRDRDRWRDRDHHGYWRDGHRGRDRW